MTIVVDTNVLVAYDNPREDNHTLAVELLKRIKGGEFGEAILCDYVFDESLTLASVRRGKALALALGESLLTSNMTRVYLTQKIFEEAWVIFKKSSDLSFTDCVIAAIAREKSAAIATFDGHFSQFKDLRIIS